MRKLTDAEWESAYWHHIATTRPARVWRLANGWEWLPWLGDDERRRRTLVWGRWVFALWHCRCQDCRNDAERLRLIVDGAP